MKYVFNGEEIPLTLTVQKEEKDLPEEIQKAIIPLRDIGSTKEIATLVDYLDAKKELLLSDSNRKANLDPVSIKQRINHEPARFNARPLSPKCMEIAYEILDKMLTDGIVEKVSTCPNISPIHLVLRDGKKPRMVVDFRHVNQGIVDDTHPLPYLKIFQRRVQPYNVFAALDLMWGFFNIPWLKIQGI